MPITVKHGGGNMEALAKLAVLMGMGRGQVPQLPGMPNIPSFGSASRGGGGGGGGTRTSGDMKFGRRAPLKYGPSEIEQERMQADEARREAQFAGPAEAERQKMMLSAKQEQHNANIQNSMKELQKSDLFSKSEKMSGMRYLERDLFGVEEGVIPNTSEDIPKGQELGKTWTDANGDMLVRRRDPNGGTYVDVRTRYQYTKEGRLAEFASKERVETAKNEAASQKLEMDRVSSAEKAQDALREKLFLTPVKGVDKQNNPTERPRTASEVAKMMKEYEKSKGLEDEIERNDILSQEAAQFRKAAEFLNVPDGEQDKTLKELGFNVTSRKESSLEQVDRSGSPEQVFDREVEALGKDWVKEAENAGTQIKDEYKNMSPEIGWALTNLDAVRAQLGDDYKSWPPDMQEYVQVLAEKIRKSRRES